MDRTIRLGTRVQVHDQDGDEEFAIVPPEEVDLARGHISMESPLGRALLGRAVGDQVAVRTPGGVRVVSVVAAR